MRARRSTAVRDSHSPQYPKTLRDARLQSRRGIGLFARGLVLIVARAYDVVRRLSGSDQRLEPQMNDTTQRISFELDSHLVGLRARLRRRTQGRRGAAAGAAEMERPLATRDREVRAQEFVPRL